MCYFDPKNGYLGQKVNFLYGNPNYYQQGISPLYPGLQLFHLDQPKKIMFLSYGSFFGAHPCIWPFWVIPQSLNFGLFSMKLCGTIRAIKKMTNNDNEQGPGQNNRETANFMFGPIVFLFGQKCFLP